MRRGYEEYQGLKNMKKIQKHIVGIIPARMGSSRFPGKPLADIENKAMIYHVYYRSKLSKLLSDNVYIATPDIQIRDYCLKHNMNVVMTKPSHQRATDRAVEAMLKIEKSTRRRIDIIVMIQGDEPLVYPKMIDLAVQPLIKERDVYVANLVSPLKSISEFKDPNTIKVVADKDNFALYFSREPIPSFKKGAARIPMLKQVCIIPFKRDFLLKFNKLKQRPLEIAESIDMLRCLEHGYKVRLVSCDFNTYSVDTFIDLQRVRRIMSEDKLFAFYRQQ